MRVKSSSVSLTRASFAIANRCSTALVDPPRAMTTVMAFSKALRVRMSRGRKPSFTNFTTASPARRESALFSSPTASCAELPGSDKPSASIAEAMVLAVYIPPQLPGPGIAVRSTSLSSASEIFPAALAPTASKTATMSRRCAPGRMVPP